MSQAKTRPGDGSIDDHLASRASGPLLDDARRLQALMSRVSGAPPVLWGSSIVGFGHYRYPLAGGRSGESCATGFAVRGRELVIYLVAEAPEQAALLQGLGPHRLGRACLYLRGLEAVDLVVLEQLVSAALAEVRRRYG